MLRRLCALLLIFVGLAHADESVRICHGYGCLVEADIRYTEGQLGEIRRMLVSAVDAENERKSLAEAIGRLYRWAGEQSPIHNDRGGNFNDDNMPGRMDCIDHTTSTTRLLHLLAARGYLRWHRVEMPEVRYLVGVFPSHWSAVLVEKGEDGKRFAVDSWFVDNGEPAVILPLDEWKKGAGPDV